MQTKLSVALAATLAGFALSAQAANVEVYGLIDTGLNYQHVDADRAGVDDVSKFQMKSSQSTPNRVGLRGTEDLGQGLKVGFVLESQFNSDDGSLMPGNRLFHRAAQIMLMSDDYGTLVLGRSGMLRSGFGTTGIWGGKVAYGRAYDKDGNLLGYDPDDSLSFSLAATYDFGFMKLYASGMYFSDMLAREFQGHNNMISMEGASGVSYKGYSLQLGTTVPAWGGTVKANVGWMDAKVDHEYLVSDVYEYGDTDRIGFSLGYVYPLSKKAEVYVGAGVTKDSSNAKLKADDSSADPIAYEVVSGLLIRF